jgi:hypothetical protein
VLEYQVVPFVITPAGRGSVRSWEPTQLRASPRLQRSGECAIVFAKPCTKLNTWHRST